MHPYEEAALGFFAPCPVLDGVVELSPAAQVEVTDAKIGAVGGFQGLLELGKEFLLDVVEDCWQDFPLGFRFLSKQKGRCGCSGLGMDKIGTGMLK